MANYATLKAAIAAAIKQNGNNEITGNLLQQQLLAMVNSLGVGYQYADIATPATNPGTPDQNVFYIASTAGTYTNFGGLVLADGEIAILKYNGTWAKDSTGAASLEMVNQIGQKLNNLADDRIIVMDDVIENSFDLLPNGFKYKVGRYANGVWHPETTIVSSLCPISYAFYPQTLNDLKPYINRNPTPVFEFYFWGNGVYKGKGTKVDLGVFSYLLPDGTITTLDQLGYIDTFSAGWLTENTETVMPYFKSPYNAINKRYIGRKYIALGDSITAGVRSDGISYAHILNNKFKFIDFESKAVSQTSCMDITGRPHLATQVDALTNNYDGIITVMIGTNDCADGVNIGSVAETMSRDYADLSRTRSFADAFRQNIETIKRKCPLATVIVLMPIQNKPYEGTQISEANLEPIRECEREICRYLSVPFLNVNWECGITIYCNWDILMYDAVHPNLTGQEVIAQYLTEKFVGLFA